MQMPTAIDRFCDEHWDEATLDDFLACVASKLAEKFVAEHPGISYEDAVQIGSRDSDGCLIYHLNRLNMQLAELLDEVWPDE